MSSIPARARGTGATILLGGALLAGLLVADSATSQVSPPLVTLHQGPDWNRSLATEFYSTDQGSRVMPLAWMRALVLPDGSGFLDDRLARYNYLPDPAAEAGLPIGFTLAEFEGRQNVGMNCAACHTRDIEVAGTRYRIDGGPAISDFQSYLADLEAATALALASDEAFTAFAERAGEKGDVAALRKEVEDWYRPYNAIVKGSLPDPAWGPGRLDAISMIFNRLAGLDIGEGPDRLILENIERADAPTRYPFLWNAARQDQTQWPGIADNGNSLLGLSRNLGQVYGVFAVFHPEKAEGFLSLNMNYLKNNSANFGGLSRLEELVWKLGPPQWPWPINQALAEEGEAIFNLSSAEGGCVECHGIRRGAVRFPNFRTWATPLMDVGTDTRECAVLARTVKTGVMEGAKIPLVGEALGAEAPAIDVLSTAVIGAIIQDKVPFGVEQDERPAIGASAPTATSRADFERPVAALVNGADPFGVPSVAAARAAASDETLTPEERLLRELGTLRGAFGDPGRAPSLSAALAEPGCKYESRVLEGIWATAPYLHSGSVASLDDLLKPASERAASFKLGPRYDIEAVGLAAEQSVFEFTLETTGCDDLDSGRSRCGHEYGTSLSTDERRALLEYLKTL